jgi:hypothetical protein
VAGNYTLAVLPDHLMFTFESRDTILVSPFDWPQDGWHHIALVHVFTRGDGISRFYFDGKRENLPGGNFWRDDFGASISGNSDASPNQGFPYNLGAVLWGSESYFAGRIDEVRIWSTVRSDEDISHYAEHKLTGTEEGLVAYWTFDNGSLADLSPNDNDGQLFGTARLCESETPVQE